MLGSTTVQVVVKNRSCSQRTLHMHEYTHATNAINYSVSFLDMQIFGFDVKTVIDCWIRIEHQELISSLPIPIHMTAKKPC
jgi:hypothetical protein